jgi:hypothetical protein
MHVWRESLSSSRLDPSLPPFALRYNKNKDTPKPNVQNAPSETKRNPSRDAVTKKKERKKERKKDTKKMNECTNASMGRQRRVCRNLRDAPQLLFLLVRVQKFGGHRHKRSTTPLLACAPTSFPSSSSSRDKAGTFNVAFAQERHSHSRSPLHRTTAPPSTRTHL